MRPTWGLAEESSPAASPPREADNEGSLHFCVYSAQNHPFEAEGPFWRPSFLLKSKGPKARPNAFARLVAQPPPPPPYPWNSLRKPALSGVSGCLFLDFLGLPARGLCSWISEHRTLPIGQCLSFCLFVVPPPTPCWSHVECGMR